MRLFEEEGVDVVLTEKNLLWSEKLIEKGVVKGIISMGIKCNWTIEDLWREVSDRYPDMGREEFNDIYSLVLDEINIAS